ncbi:hypothetical protein [Shewanella marisflavi]|nr:hypothetical protein [Shewanella marisflavi]
MKRFKSNRLVRALGIALISSASLYGATTSTANADLFPGLEREYCMANAYLAEDSRNSLPQDSLNCTANDVEITEVTNPSLKECTPGDIITFTADIKVRTNANERYDTTFYLPLTDQSPQDVSVQLSNDENINGLTYPFYCSLLLPMASDALPEQTYSNLDFDACGDITKKWGNDTYELKEQSITMLCIDEDDNNEADFHYCAAWDNQERDNCTVDRDPVPGQVPNTKSKCNCATLNVPILIKAPTVEKTLIGTNTHDEPGGVYEFSLSLTNPNKLSSLFIASLSDEIDIGADGNYDKSIDLWGPTEPVGTDDGIYLVFSNCEKPVDPETRFEIAPSATYSCTFKVHIVDTDLPDLPDTPTELYNDVIKLALEKRNESPVLDGVSCSSVGVSAVDGEHCSNIKQVQVTNKSPVIKVTKTPYPTQVPESGGDVEYTVTVELIAPTGTWDSPMKLTYLNDDKFNNVFGISGTDCTINTMIYLGVPYTCHFTGHIDATNDPSHKNEVTAWAYDNENTKAVASGSATVLISNIPSSITLEKTANPTSVPETGDDLSVFRKVNYTFKFSVDDMVNGQTTVDPVTFSSLTDDVFLDLTDKCKVDTRNGNPIPEEPLLGFVLLPGESASCTVEGLDVQGNFGDTHTNEATIKGKDEDGQDVMAMDTADVTFIKSEGKVKLDFAASMLVVVRMTNDDIFNATLTGMTVGGKDVFTEEALIGSFRLLNNGGDFDMTPYGDCVKDHPFGYLGAIDDFYECAFTIEFEPGLENKDAIGLLQDIIVTLTNSRGDTFNASVTVKVETQE